MQVAFLTWRNGVVHSLDLCFMYLGSRAAAPDFSREATQDDFSPLQDALFSRIKPETPPRHLPESSDLCLGLGSQPQTPPMQLPNMIFLLLRKLCPP